MGRPRHRPVAALPDDPTEPLSRDPSEVALRAFVRARKRKDQVAMRESWQHLLGLEWARTRILVQGRRHEQLPGGRIPTDDVDEVVNDVFVRLHDWLKLEGDSIGEARAIIRHAVKFAVLDRVDAHVRDDRHRAGSFDEDDPDGDGPAAFVRRVEEELADLLNDPFEDSERATAIREAIADLPEKPRRVVVLRLSGVKAKEVAEATGLGASNVDQIFSRGLVQLQKALKDLR